MTNVTSAAPLVSIPPSPAGARSPCCLRPVRMVVYIIYWFTIPVGMQVRWYSFQFILAQLTDELSDMHNAMVRLCHLCDPAACCNPAICLTLPLQHFGRALFFSVLCQRHFQMASQDGTLICRRGCWSSFRTRCCRRRAPRQRPAAHATAALPTPLC